MSLERYALPSLALLLFLPVIPAAFRAASLLLHESLQLLPQKSTLLLRRHPLHRPPWIVAAAAAEIVLGDVLGRAATKVPIGLFPLRVLLLLLRGIRRVLPHERLLLLLLLLSKSLNRCLTLCGLVGCQHLRHRVVGAAWPGRSAGRSPAARVWVGATSTEHAKKRRRCVGKHLPRSLTTAGLGGLAWRAGRTRGTSPVHRNDAQGAGSSEADVLQKPRLVHLGTVPLRRVGADKDEVAVSQGRLDLGADAGLEGVHVRVKLIDGERLPVG